TAEQAHGSQGEHADRARLGNNELQAGRYVGIPSGAVYISPNQLERIRIECVAVALRAVDEEAGTAAAFMEGRLNPIGTGGQVIMTKLVEAAAVRAERIVSI